MSNLVGNPEDQFSRVAALIVIIKIRNWIVNLGLSDLLMVKGHLMGKATMWFQNMFDSNWAVQAQKMARNFGFIKGIVLSVWRKQRH